MLLCQTEDNSVSVWHFNVVAGKTGPGDCGTQAFKI